MSVIVIDPGHGGTTAVGGSSPNNATGPAGTLERDLTLEVGLLVEPFLTAQGHTVVLTRTTDVNLGLADRAQVARSHTADVFVSIHFNGWTDPATQGTETLHHPSASDDSKLLAAAVQQRVLLATEHTDRGVKPQSLGVLDPARHALNTAGCLLEVSFLTDPAEETRLTDVNYKTRIAEQIAFAIVEYIARQSGP